MPTGLIQLSPQFLEAVRQVAPKKKRSKAWWVVIAIACVGALFVAAHPKTRAFVAAKAKDGIARVRGAPPAPPAVSTAPPIVSAQSLVTEPAASVPAVVRTAPSASVAPPAIIAPSTSVVKTPKRAKPAQKKAH